MPNQPVNIFEGSFTKGLITEATALNFPENAATDMDNCVVNIPGDITRRLGVNFEANGSTSTIDRTNSAMSSYIWNNPGGDGNSKLFVRQVGDTLYFYDISSATSSDPLSTQALTGTVLLSPAIGNTVDKTAEAQFSDGNGYLFVYHTSCDPSYVTYDPVSFKLTSYIITVQTRDLYGLNDNLKVTQRPATLSTEHNYNIQNQGWTTGNSWDTTSVTSILGVTGTYDFTVAAAIANVSGGDVYTGTANIQIYSEDFQSAPGIFLTTLYCTISGTVTSYVGTDLKLSVNSVSYSGNFSGAGTSTPHNFGGDGSTWQVNPPNPLWTEGNTLWQYSVWTFSSLNTSTITTWNSAEGNYPSNADVWWYFTNSSGTFDPATTQPYVSLSTGNAPQGHYILNAFDMDRSLVSGIANINKVSTTKRPVTGCFTNGRVWYTGINDSQATAGDVKYYTWSENIYFSQVIQTPNDFGSCYQFNDPTSENLNSLLPTDGGIITLVGCGTIHKLFPIQNGLLVFANNGVWFITGSKGIGFSADDYTITKLSNVQTLSNTSFIDVMGLPFFWTEDGIYSVVPSSGGALAVTPLTVSTIRTAYNNIPVASKGYARGDYDRINYVIKWVYRSTQESSVTNRYEFDSVICFNTYLKCFYTYSIAAGNNSEHVHDVKYVTYPYAGNGIPLPSFKYPCSKASSNTYSLGFAEEYDTTYKDWGSSDYTSTFTTGFTLAKSSFLKLYSGEGQKKMQVSYLFLYSRNNDYNSYYIQSLWDFASTYDSNRWSNQEFHENFSSNYSFIGRKYKPRGRGLALQFKVTSVSGQPFDIVGWSAYAHVNVGI